MHSRLNNNVFATLKSTTASTNNMQICMSHLNINEGEDEEVEEEDKIDGATPPVDLEQFK
jgi:hypothetical protein